MTTFPDFLKAHSIPKDSNVKPTHTRIGDKYFQIYGGSYNIPPNELPEFYKLYYDYVFVQKNKEYLTEKQYGNVIAVDFDFRYCYDTDTRQHSRDDVEGLMCLYLEKLKEFYMFDENTNFDVFIFEKPNVNRLADGSLTKDGIHIIIGLKMDFDRQQELRKRILNEIKLNELFNNLPLINTWESVLDDGITKGQTNMQLFGSRKPGNEAYELTEYHKVTFDPNDGEFMIEKINIKNFDIKNNFHRLSVQFDGTPKYTEKPIEIKKESKNKKQKKILIVEDDDEQETDKETENEMYDETEILKRKETIENDLKKLDKTKFETHENYLKIILGICDYLGYKDFEFCEKITKEYCNDKKQSEFDGWFKSVTPRKSGNRITYATIKSWIEKDKLEKLMNGIERKVLTSGYLADIFVALYGNDYKTIDDNLYCWNGVYWEKSDKKHSKLVNKIDKDLINYLIAYQQYLPNSTKEELERIGKYIISVAGFRDQVKRKKVVEDVITFSKPLKPIELNSNPYLFAFNNVIFDLRTGGKIEPNRDDYVSVTCGYDWVEPTKEQNETIKTIINQILPNNELAEYYLQALSTGMAGIHIQHLFVASGVGGNGKSVLDSALLTAFGNYGYKIPSSMLQQDIKSGANPEVNNLNYKRFALGSEPSSKKKFAMSVIKELTGNSTINSRGLYSDSCEIKLVLSLFVECNDKPDLDEVNEAVERRLRVIPFVSRFVSAEDYEVLKSEYPNIYKRNTHYDSDAFRQEHRCSLISFLMPYFKKFYENKEELPTTPEIIKKASDTYMKNSDNIYEWFNENYEKSEKSIIYCSDVYKNYKESDKFRALSKQKQGDLSKDKLVDKLQNNLNLKKYLNFKRRGECVDLGMTKLSQLTKDGFYGWKKKVIECDDVDEESNL